MKRQPTFFGGNSGEDRLSTDAFDLESSEVEESYVEYNLKEKNRFNTLKELSAIRDAFRVVLLKEKELSEEEESYRKSNHKDARKSQLTMFKLMALQSFLNIVKEKITEFNQVNITSYKDFINSGRMRFNTWTSVDYNALICAHLVLEILCAVSRLSVENFEYLFAERDNKKDTLVKTSKSLGQSVGALAGYPLAMSDTAAKAGGGAASWLFKKVTNVSDKRSTTEMNITSFLQALNNYLVSMSKKYKLDLQMPMIDMNKIVWLSPKTERKEGEIYLELQTVKEEKVNEQGLTVETSSTFFCASSDCCGKKIVVDLLSGNNQIPEFKKLKLGDPLSTLCKLTIFALVAKKMKELQLGIKLTAGLNEFSDAYIEQQKRNAAKSISKLEQKSQLSGSTEGEFDEVAEEEKEVEEQFVEQEEEERESLSNSM